MFDELASKVPWATTLYRRPMLSATASRRWGRWPWALRKSPGTSEFSEDLKVFKGFTVKDHWKSIEKKSIYDMR